MVDNYSLHVLLLFSWCTLFVSKLCNMIFPYDFPAYLRVGLSLHVSLLVFSFFSHLRLKTFYCTNVNGCSFCAGIDLYGSALVARYLCTLDPTFLQLVGSKHQTYIMNTSPNNLQSSISKRESIYIKLHPPGQGSHKHRRQRSSLGRRAKTLVISHARIGILATEAPSMQC